MSTSPAHQSAERNPFGATAMLGLQRLAGNHATTALMRQRTADAPTQTPASSVAGASLLPGGLRPLSHSTSHPRPLPQVPKDLAAPEWDTVRESLGVLAGAGPSPAAEFHSSTTRGGWL